LRNKADFGGRQQIIFRAIGELSGRQSVQTAIVPENGQPAATTVADGPA
jgi:hypothetical protein